MGSTWYVYPGGQNSVLVRAPSDALRGHPLAARGHPRGAARGVVLGQLAPDATDSSRVFCLHQLHAH
eukprot:14025845-Heterocapsa_arctica.AAC.1